MTIPKVSFFAGFLVAVIVFSALIAGFNYALAAWQEPTAAPPAGNIDPFSTDLVSVLEENADAGSFVGNIFIGSANSVANFYLAGGELRSKWLHATEPGNNTIAGSLGLGLNPSEKLDVNGNVRATAFLYSSDASLKYNVATITDPVAKIMKLRGVSFQWKSTGDAGLGFIAQEVETVFPELVTTDRQTGLKSIQYANIIAPLVEAVKKQQTIIDELSARIKVLESK